MSDNLNRSLQENLITLLCFDDKAASIIVSNVEPDLFESTIYREIVIQASNFYNEYKTPIKDHIIDVFDHIINGKDEKKAQLYRDTFIAIDSLKDTIHKDYVLNELDKFIRQQKLKMGIREAAELVQSGKIDQAELVLDSCKKDSLKVFDPGVCFFDREHKGLLGFLNNKDEFYSTGITELDKLGICPAPKELYTIMGLPNKGKSWFLIHMGKYALLQKKKVLHITLEMSADRVCMRYVQSFFGMARHERYNNRNTIFKKTEDGAISNMSFEYIEDNKIRNFNEPDIDKVIKKKMGNLFSPKLIVKEFPTAQLTMTMLRAYLNNLESFYNFVPDVLLLDYPDLMHIDIAYARLDTARIYKELRGIGVERGIAVVVPTQANRVGESAALLTREHSAEDYSKIMTADNSITYNQSREEKALGLARLYVDKGRNDRSGDIILIAQNYSIGQFCLDSALLTSDKEYNNIRQGLV